MDALHQESARKKIFFDPLVRYKNLIRPLLRSVFGASESGLTFLSFGKTEKFDKCCAGLTPNGGRAQKKRARKKKGTCKVEKKQHVNGSRARKIHIIRT